MAQLKLTLQKRACYFGLSLSPAAVSVVNLLAFLLFQTDVPTGDAATAGAEKVQGTVLDLLAQAVAADAARHRASRPPDMAIKSPLQTIKPFPAALKTAVWNWCLRNNDGTAPGPNPNAYSFYLSL